MDGYPEKCKIVGLVLSRIQEPKVEAQIDADRSEINIGDVTFRLIDDAISFEFYDWLRTASGQIIGFRSFYEPGEISSYLANRKNVVLFPDTEEFYVYFGTERTFDESRPLDQLFGNSELFEGSDGAIMLTVDLPEEDAAISTNEGWRLEDQIDQLRLSGSPIRTIGCR